MDMISSALHQFINTEDGRLNDILEIGRNSREVVLARTIKISEEVGELCEEVLAANGGQRPGKSKKRDVDSIGGEFADVIITSLLLARALNVDIDKALRNKIEKINRRYSDSTYQKGSQNLSSSGSGMAA